MGVGIIVYRRWAKEEAQYLVDNFAIKDIDAIAIKLDRSKDSVYKKAMRLKLTKIVGFAGIRWIKKNGLKKLGRF